MVFPRPLTLDRICHIQVEITTGSLHADMCDFSIQHSWHPACTTFVWPKTSEMNKWCDVLFHMIIRGTQQRVLYIVRLLSFNIVSWTELAILLYIRQTGRQERCLSSVDCSWLHLKSTIRLLLLKEHRFVILSLYPNETSVLSVLSYADNYLSHVFHFTPFLCVMSSRRMPCLSTKLGHRLIYFCILLERNKLSNGKGILLHENFLIIFSHYLLINPRIACSPSFIFVKHYVVVIRV